jgi:hypothetical protein
VREQRSQRRVVAAEEALQAFVGGEVVFEAPYQVAQLRPVVQVRWRRR